MTPNRQIIFFIHRLPHSDRYFLLKKSCCAPFRCYVFVFAILAKFGVRLVLSAPRNVFFILHYVLVPGPGGDDGDMDDDDGDIGSGEPEPEPQG